MTSTVLTKRPLRLIHGFRGLLHVIRLLLVELEINRLKRLLGAPLRGIPVLYLALDDWFLGIVGNEAQYVLVGRSWRVLGIIVSHILTLTK